MGMTPKNKDRIAYENSILEKLDVVAEWKDLVGLRIAGAPGANGWVSCYAIDGEDKTPSAGLCVRGSKKGCYRDHRSGETAVVGLIQKAAELRFGGNCNAAREYYASKAGVAPQQDVAVEPVSKNNNEWNLEFRYDAQGRPGKPTAGQIMTFCDHKHGVTQQAIEDCGGVAAVYPNHWKPQVQNRTIAFPMSVLDGNVCGWHFTSADPRKLLKVAKGEERKVSSKGSLGFLNAWGIAHLPTAKVVWIVEGLSDTLAGQAVVRKDGLHVILGIPGCSATPWPEAIKQFSDKQVNVCLDVGDKNDAGQKGAAKWCNALSGTAAVVKNVLLPCEGGDKVDLRDWLHAGKKTYVDMLDLAAKSPVWVPTGKADTTSLDAAGFDLSVPGAEQFTSSQPLSYEQQLLDRLGCVVCGIIQGTNFIEVYSTINCTNYTIKSLNGFSIHEATLAFGGKAVGEVISQEKEPPPGKVPIFVVRQAIATVASGNIINDHDSIGAGMWEIDGDVVLVGKAAAHRYTTDREFLPIKSPLHRGRRIDFSGNIVWYDEDRVAEMLKSARDPRWRLRVVQDLLDIFGRWDNWELGSSVEVATGLVLATWAQTLWSFRPHVCISGPSDCGKTTMIGTLMKGMFNGICAPMQKSSAAGLRQKVRNTGMILAIDEFEEGAGRREILELLRTSTRGGRISLGSQAGRGQEYGLRHIAWVAGIEVGLTQEADRNRFISLDLRTVDKTDPNRKDFSLPGTAYLHELGERAMATAMYSIREARIMAEQLNTAVKVQGLNSRYIEGFAVPASMLAVNSGIDLETICETVKTWIDERAIVENKITDEEVLIGRILTSKIGESGKMFTVESLLQACLADDYHSSFVFELDPNLRVSGPDAHRMLEANGVKFYRDEKEVFIDPDAANRFLLANTNLKDKDLKQLLKRIEGAREGQRRVVVEGGSTAGTKSSSRRRGVFIPVSAFI